MSSIDPVGRRGTWKSLQLHVLDWVRQRNLKSCGDVTDSSKITKCPSVEYGDILSTIIMLSGQVHNSKQKLMQWNS